MNGPFRTAIAIARSPRPALRRFPATLGLGWLNRPFRSEDNSQGTGVLPVGACAVNNVRRRNDSRPRRAQVCATVWRSVEREAPNNPDTDKQCRVSTRGDGTACSSAMRVAWQFRRISRRLPSSGTPRINSPLCRRGDARLGATPRGTGVLPVGACAVDSVKCRNDSSPRRARSALAENGRLRSDCYSAGGISVVNS